MAWFLLISKAHQSGRILLKEQRDVDPPVAVTALEANDIGLVKKPALEDDAAVHSVRHFEDFQTFFLIVGILIRARLLLMIVTPFLERSGFFPKLLAVKVGTDGFCVDVRLPKRPVVRWRFWPDQQTSRPKIKVCFVWSQPKVYTDLEQQQSEKQATVTRGFNRRGKQKPHTKVKTQKLRHTKGSRGCLSRCLTAPASLWGSIPLSWPSSYL